MSRSKEQVPLLPVLSAVKPKTSKASPLFPKNKGKGFTKLLSKSGRQVQSVMSSPHDVSTSPYYSYNPTKEKTLCKLQERAKKKSKSAKNSRRRHSTKPRIRKTVKAPRKSQDLPLSPRAKPLKKTKNNVGFPSYIPGSTDSSLKDHIENVHDSESIKQFGDEKLPLMYPADSTLSNSERPASPGCAGISSLTSLKSTNLTKRSVRNAYDRVIWK